MVSAADVLGAVSGLGPVEASKIVEQVKANMASLAGCRGPHEFAPEGDPARPFGKFRCALCGGVVDPMAKTWYERGLLHAKG